MSCTWIIVTYKQKSFRGLNFLMRMPCFICSSKSSPFLNERSEKLESKKNRFVHRKLRSAFRSLMNNLPYLFTWYDHLELNIPHTTNAIDGHFSDLKTNYATIME
jgi:hypothetical protein